MLGPFRTDNTELSIRISGRTASTVENRLAKMSQLMEKPRWVNKMKTVFQRLDIKKRGYITKEDWLTMADRVREKSGFAPDDPKATAHRSSLSQVYDDFCCGKEKLTPEEYVECISVYCAQQDALRRKQQTTSFMTMNDALFQALDADSNGWLSAKEYEGVFYLFNYPDYETMAAQTFDIVDKNKDGKISPEEFEQFSFEFWMTDEDESDVQGMCGPDFELPK